MNKNVWIVDFKIVQPLYFTAQETILEWLKESHVYAEDCSTKQLSKKTLIERLNKYYCGSDKISKRGHLLKDFLHTEWSEMEIFNLKDCPTGKLMGERMDIFDKYVSTIFHQFYEDINKGPDHLIHVTCTGYNAPSSAQKLVEKKRWHQQTVVSHAYHMGCLAALPALRIGRSFLFENPLANIDIAHTEICSLHFNPLGHEPEDIVGQSLFADGFIKYSLSTNPTRPILKIRSLYEELIPHTTEKMKWQPTEWGMQFVLSKEIPLLILRNLQEYLLRLSHRAGLSLENLLKEATFAIHPGGPKIIDYIQKELSLTDKQVEASRKILFEHGNMSSATLPHIWKEIAENSSFKPGYIVTIGFGPGLTMSGAILEKE